MSLRSAGRHAGDLPSGEVPRFVAERRAVRQNFSYKYLYIGFFHYIFVVERRSEAERGRKVPYFHSRTRPKNNDIIDTKKITEAAERHLEGTDMFVVECTSTPGNEIELTIDSDTSVGIDACVALSRAVEADLDRDAEDFSLTVASAGIGSELRTLRQYRKLVGRPVEVLLTNGVKILAHLDEATDEGVTLSYEEKQAVEGRKRKQPVKVTRSYPFAQIKYTKEWLDFK